MHIDELHALVARGESETLEFKRTTGQLSAAMRTVCAMLNGLGGYVLFGVEDDGQVIGQQVAKKTEEQLANELRRIEPPAFPDLEFNALPNGKTVIALQVNGSNGPFTYDGRSYIRSGPTTGQMPREQHERLIINKAHATERWENQPVSGLTITDLDEAEIQRTIEEAIRCGRIGDPGTRDPKEILLGLGLIHKGQLLNAAVVLFGRSQRLAPIYPQCLLRMARFRGNNTSEFVDNRQELGNEFDLFVRA